MTKVIGKIKDNKILSFTIIYWLICLVLTATAFKSDYETGSDDPVYAGDIDMTADYGQSGFDIPAMEIDRGIYALTMAYETNGFATLAFDSDGSAGDVGVTETLLTPYSGYAEPYVYVYRDGIHLSGRISANNPDTSLKLVVLSLRRMRKLSAAYTALRLIAMFAVLYLAIFVIRLGGRKASVSVDANMIKLLTVTVISMAGFIPGIMGRYIAGGHDIEAHMGRIAAIADGLGMHVFPVRMYRFFANDYGYPMGVFYGDILLYPEAVLHRLGLPLWQCYIVLVALISLLTAIVSYLSFKAIAGNDRAALLATSVYMLSPWRLIDIYVRAAAGEYAAMAFIPLIAAGFWLILRSDREDGHAAGKGGLMLMLGFTGLIHTHMITCIMAAVFSVFYCIIYIKRLVTGKRIVPLVISAICTVLLNLSFIVPFADMYLKNDYIVEHLSRDIGGHGAYIRQLLTFAGDYAEVSYPVGEALDLTGEMPLAAGPILPLILLLIIFCVSRKDKEHRPEGIIIAVFMLLAAFLSTRYFPYGVIADIGIPVLSILNRVQFPWRYLVIVTLMISLGVLYVYNRLGSDENLIFGLKTGDGQADKAALKGVGALRIFVSAVFAIALIQACILICRQNTADNKHVNAGNVYPIITALMDSDVMYLPEGMDPDILKDRSIHVSSDELTVQDMGYDGREYTAGIANVSDVDGWISLPLTYYPGYVSSQGLKIEQDTDGRVRLSVPAGYSGVSTVGFKEPWYWRMSEIITAVMIVSMAVIAICRHRKRKDLRVGQTNDDGQ